MTDENGTLYPIILNSSNLVSLGGNNNVYRYSFPIGSVKFENSKIAVSNISLYYSWFNITSANQNNQFQFRWPTGGTENIYTVTIPDGFYDISALNTYLQQFCITNSLYLINSSSQFVYYLEYQINPNAYAIQVNCYPLPTSLPAGWSAPVGFPAYPTSTWTPRLIVPATNFRNLIGFAASTYPAAQQTTTQSFLSTTTPQVTPVSSVIMTCSSLNNKFSNPGTILYSFSPAGTTFGSLIQSSPNQYSFINIQDGNYSSFDIAFLDQNFNALQLRDSNLIIQLLIRSGIKGTAF